MIEKSQVSNLVLSPAKTAGWDRVSRAVRSKSGSLADWELPNGAIWGLPRSLSA